MARVNWSVLSALAVNAACWMAILGVADRALR